MKWIRSLAVAGGGIAALALALSHTAPSQAADASFVGSSNCKKCHFKQFKSWQASTMALTFDVLKPGERADAKTAAGLDANTDYTGDATCLPCHTTGYGQAGGFTSIDETPDLAGVGCESCHGAGSSYLEIMTAKYKDHPIKEMTDRGLIYPSNADTCTQCHNDKSPFYKEFAFDTAVKDAAGVHEHSPLKGSHPDIGDLGVLFQ